MRTWSAARWTVWTSLALVVCLCGMPALAQLLDGPVGAPAQDQNAAARAVLTPLCDQAGKTDEAEKAALATYTSPALTEALRSEPAMWALIVDPATSYMDRMAAAKQGATLVRPEDLQAIWKTRTELERFPAGVTASPCQFLWADNLNPEMWFQRGKGDNGWGGVPATGERDVLGHTVHLPLPVVDYPVTAEQRERAPWMWQARQAVALLVDAVNKRYREPELYPKLVQAMWAWEPKDFDEASDRYHAMSQNAPHTLVWLQTMVKLAVGDDPFHTNELAPMEIYVHGQDSFHFEELEQAALVVILVQAGSERAAEEAASSVKKLATEKYNCVCPHLKPLWTATAVLAIAKWADDPKLSSQQRYGFASAIVAMSADAPFAPYENRALSQDELVRRVAAFETWFAPQRAALAEQARAEAQHQGELVAEVDAE